MGGGGAGKEGGKKKKKKENSTEMQKPSADAEVYKNNKKCDLGGKNVQKLNWIS